MFSHVPLNPKLKLKEKNLQLLGPSLSNTVACVQEKGADFFKKFQFREILPRIETTSIKGHLYISTNISVVLECISIRISFLEATSMELKV